MTAKSGKLTVEAGGHGPTGGAPGGDEEQLSRTFAALADPTRRAILTALAGGELHVSEVAAPLPISQPAVSRHLRVLERAGLVRRTTQAQWRRLRLEAAPLREAAGWIEHYRRFWDASFSRLDTYLRELQDAGMDVHVVVAPEGETAREISDALHLAGAPALPAPPAPAQSGARRDAGAKPKQDAAAKSTPPAHGSQGGRHVKRRSRRR